MNDQPTFGGEPAMNDPPLDDTVHARMQGIRGEIDQDLQDVSASTIAWSTGNTTWRPIRGSAWGRRPCWAS